MRSLRPADLPRAQKALVETHVAAAVIVPAGICAEPLVGNGRPILAKVPA